MSAAELPADPPPLRGSAPPLAPVPATGSDHGGRRLVAGALVSWLPFAAAMVVTAGLVYAAVQQSLRSGANDPQLQIAGDLAAQLSGGASAGPLLGTSKVDVATSLSPYAVVFDGAGRPVAATGVLDGAVPVPPPGVLRAAQGHRTELTWEPRDGVRSAIVVLPFHGPQGTGTVMVGRSLTEVEKRETLLVELVAAGLLGGLGATAAACLLAAWLRRRPSLAG
jgi:hypothetical protein